MTIESDLRILFGLSTDVVSDELMTVIVNDAREWCNDKASAYHVVPPESAVKLMAQVFLRENLDLRGIKPSSISMPDLSMSTDLRSICDKLTEDAMSQIKSAAYARGSAVKHIRSGKVPLRWQ